MKQMVNVECVLDFKDRPLIDLQFRYLSFNTEADDMQCSSELCIHVYGTRKSSFFHVGGTQAKMFNNSSQYLS